MVLGEAIIMLITFILTVFVSAVYYVLLLINKIFPNLLFSSK